MLIQKTTSYLVLRNGWALGRDFVHASRRAIIACQDRRLCQDAREQAADVASPDVWPSSVDLSLAPTVLTQTEASEMIHLALSSNVTAGSRENVPFYDFLRLGNTGTDFSLF